jgi:hypothetical protein
MEAFSSLSRMNPSLWEGRDVPTFGFLEDSNLLLNLLNRGQYVSLSYHIPLGVNSYRCQDYQR